MRSLYKNTYCRVKYNGKISEAFSQDIGVNQGGNASPILFRKYLADLKDYLSEKFGVCMSEEEILVHLAWADDLILAADGENGLQKRMNG